MVFTINGKKELAKWLGGESAVQPTYVAYGDGSTAPLETDTDLDNEIGDREITVNTVSGLIVEQEASLETTELNGSTIREVALLSASSGGVLFGRSVNFDINKTSSFEIRTLFQTRFR